MPTREAESQYLNPDSESLDNSSSNDQQAHLQFSTLESSLATYSSPDTQSYGSPISVSCITEDPNDFKCKLKELESAMLGPDSDSIDYPTHLSMEPEQLTQMLGIPRGDLKQLLIACAKAVAENDLFLVKFLVPELRQMVSVSGEPIERLGAYLLEGLIARLASSGSSIYKASQCKAPQSSELLSYMHLLYEACPYLKFGYMSANGAIAEAVKGEKMVHIVDFQVAQGTQWMTLMQALAATSGGPPHIKITGIDDPRSAHARGGGLHIVGQRLQRVAELCRIPFEFHGLAMLGHDIELKHLDVRPGEALVVNFPYQLHHLPDESVSTRNDRDRVLRMIKSLSPKVVTLVEQESNTNTCPFFPRFLETLDFYTAMFESIDVTLSRDEKERTNVEQHCLATDIVNIISCEGTERVERHELYGKWKSRFTMAGFRPYPLSPLVNATIKALLENYCEHYRLEERDGVLYLGWKNRALVVCSAWQ